MIPFRLAPLHIRHAIVFFALALGIGSFGRAAADAPAAETGVRILVGGNEIARQAVLEFATHAGGRVRRTVGAIGLVQLEVPSRSVPEVLSVLKTWPDVRYVNLDHPIQVPDAETMEIEDSTPPHGMGGEDPGLGKQWGLGLVDVFRAWRHETGNHDLLVAVVDTGVDATHPDLVNRIRADLAWDFAEEDSIADDGVGHGTHVAGIIAAERGNGEGVAGLAQVSVLPVKVFDDKGLGTWGDVAAGIVYAVDRGARIVNLSIVGEFADPAVRDAVTYAESAGVLCVAAGGNLSTDHPSYPAAFPQVIGVSALNRDAQPAVYSNYGVLNISLAAPGGSSFERAGKIYSTLPGGRYGYMSGTSMAAPHVSGVAALYLSYRPDAGLDEVRSALFRYADDMGESGTDPFYGYGLVDAFPPKD